MDSQPRHSEQVLDHFHHPRQAGSFPLNAPGVGTGRTEDAESGNTIQIQLKVSGAGLIEDARFRAFGCPSAIACASLIAEQVVGKPLAAAAAITFADIEQALSLAAGKRRCSILAQRALSAAVEDSSLRLAPGFAAVLPLPSAGEDA